MKKSPFPGMDPYLEARWSNVHALMMGAITAALNSVLPETLEARTKEEIRVETIAGERLRGYGADVAVVGADSALPIAATALLPAGIARSIQIPYEHAPITLRNVQIVDVSHSNRVVTVVEVLSPWNKRTGDLNRKYVRKLRDFEAAGTNWVEIDLLRSSRNRLLVTWQDIPENDQADYLLTTYRADDEKVTAYPISLRDPLPTVLIPLRNPAEDIAMDLQAILDRVYEEGRFRSLNYSKPPVPPLRGKDAKWAVDLIQGSHGIR